MVSREEGQADWLRGVWRLRLSVARWMPAWGADIMAGEVDMQQRCRCLGLDGEARCMGAALLVDVPGDVVHNSAASLGAVEARRRRGGSEEGAALPRSGYQHAGDRGGALYQRAGGAAVAVVAGLAI